MSEPVRTVDAITSWLVRSRCLPRTATMSALATIAVHMVAMALATAPRSTSTWSWLALLGADFILLAAILVAPDRFRLRTFSLPAVLVVTTTVIILIPMPWLFRTYDQFLPSETVLSIALGTSVLWLTLAFTPMSVAARSTGYVVVSRRRLPAFVPLVVLASLVVLPVWLRALPEIPIVRLLTGSDAATVADLRHSALRGLEPAPLRAVVSVLRNVYLHFATAWFAADWAANRQVRPERANRSLGALAVTFGVSAVFALVTTERAIVGQLVLVCAVAMVTVTGRGLTARLTAVLATVGIAFPILFGAAVSGGSPLTRLAVATQGIRRRTFYLPADVMTHYFTAFPAQQDFLGGRSIPKAGRFLDGGAFNLPGYIFELYYRRRATAAGNANGSFLGAGWANYAVSGVVAWCFLAGVSVVVLEGFVRRRAPRSGAALRGVFVVQVALLTQADLFRSVLSFAPGVLDVALLVWASERVLSRHRLARPLGTRRARSVLA